MTSAFDWSPGGCCCDVAGMFDVWSSGNGNGAGSAQNGHALIRQATIRPEAQSTLWASDSPGAIDWFTPYISPDTVPRFSVSATGFPAFEKRVWIVEDRLTPTLTRYLVCYDSETKQELFAIAANVGASFSTASIHAVNQSIGGAATSQTNFAVFDGTTLLVFDNTGHSTSTAAFFYNTIGNTTETVDCFAWRNWPKGAGSRFVGFGSTPSESTLWIGDVVAGGGALSLANKQTVVSAGNPQPGGTYITYTWLHYDSSPTHWCGIINKAVFTPQSFGVPASTVNSYLLYIDGAKIAEYRRPDDGTGNQYGNILVFGSPHVCHPHETLGDGWIAVPTKIFAYPPSAAAPAGTLEDSLHAYSIILYKEGVESWRTPKLWPYPNKPTGQWSTDDISTSQAPSLISSDRWLYLDDLTRLRKTPATFSDIWRHDGSANFRSGRLKADGTTIPDQWSALPGPAVGRVQPRPGLAVVQNSATLQNSLPLEWPPNS